jgi:hypothetical protein
MDTINWLETFTKKSQFAEAQIVSILKQADAALNVADVCPTVVADKVGTKRVSKHA